MKIKFKLWILILGSFIFTMVIVADNFMVFSRIDWDSIQVNNIGGLRAKNYKMAFLAEEILRNSSKDELKKELKENAEEFESVLNGLINGNEKIQKVRFTTTLEKLKSIKLEWEKEIIPDYKNLMESEDSQGVETLKNDTTKMHTAINDAVEEYAKLSKKEWSVQNI